MEAATLCNFEPEDDYYAFAESQATPVEPDLIPGVKNLGSTSSNLGLGRPTR
jgi:hypothetical protein